VRTAGEDRKYGWVTPRPRTEQDAVNRRIYSSSMLVLAYARRSLSDAESAFFERHSAAIRGARVLELGCGAGRITRHLVVRAREVVGIDVSPAMIDYCRRRIPRGTYVVRDLRDLGAYGDESFEVVVAAANVLDAISHEERLAVLDDLHRLLVPGGLLYFSSHNRNSAVALAEARRGPQFRLAKNPYRQARAAMSYVQGRRNHPRFAELQRFEEEYALLNDEAHGWRLLHYYIDRATQERQLSAAGFRLVETIAANGRLLGETDDDSGFTELHYVARSSDARSS
jgi:SAM-dependent methyltransferase